MAQEQRGRIRTAESDYDARQYRGGSTFQTKDGYVMEMNPLHPYRNRHGYVRQHRLVMERGLARILEPGEIVHHRNKNRSDNRIENLELFSSQAEHMEHHQQDALCRNPEVIERVRVAAADPKATMRSLDVSYETVRRVCEMHGIRWISPGEVLATDDQAREALRGRTTEEAARFLGVSLQTMYNRFDHLLDKRNSPGFLDAHREELCRIASEKGIPTACETFGTNRQAVYEAFERWGIQDQVTYRGKQDLDKMRDEVLKLVQEHGYSRTAKILGKSKGGIQFAVKRWSEQGDLPDGFALPPSSQKRRRSALGHMDLTEVPLLQEPVSVPPTS